MSLSPLSILNCMFFGHVDADWSFVLFVRYIFMNLFIHSSLVSCFFYFLCFVHGQSNRLRKRSSVPRPPFPRRAVP